MNNGAVGQPTPAEPSIDEGNLENAIPSLDEQQQNAEDSQTEDQPLAGAAKKSKKKKKKSQKKPAVEQSQDSTNLIPPLDNSHFRLLNSWPACTTSQTDPPTVPIDELYPSHNYPLGEVCQYGGNNSYRFESEEKKEREKLFEEDYQAIRRGAECHRQVRKYAQSFIKPGLPLVDLVTKLEAKTMELVKANQLEAGKGFPTGVSLNNCAAHYTPNYGDDRVLQHSDVVKVDFGIQVRGRIVDSAFTIAFDPKYDEIIKASQDGTNAGLREAGIDARFSDIGAAIQEAIESYEYDDHGTVYPIKPVRNLNGHSIDLYRVHGGKSVPIVANNDPSIMEEGEHYAIETFASTGRGVVQEVGECSHYMKVFDAPHVPLRLKTARDLLRCIDANFGTLAFCRRWLDDLGHTRHIMALKSLCQSEIVKDYPPLSDQANSIVTQMEHTVVLRPTCKEIVSRGDDY